MEKFMNTKFLLSTILSIPLFIGNLSASSKPSDELKAALEGLDKSKVKCYCVCEFDGKSQLAAGTEMSKILEGELLENENKILQDKNLPSMRLSDYINGFIGLSSGSLLAAHMALGGNASGIKEALLSFDSKMIATECAAGCLNCVGKTKQIASYLANNDAETGNAPEQIDSYDAIVLNQKAIGTISRVSSGTNYDLKAGLTILSTSKSNSFAEQVIAAIDESDNAAKKNVAKIAFDNLLGTAIAAVELAGDIAGQKINKTAAGKALDIMTRIGEGVEKVNSVLDNTLFKRNLIQNLAKPTKTTPLLVIDLKSQMGTGKAIKTSMKQEFRENFVKVTYLTEIPLSMYPTKKLSFETVNSQIGDSVKDCLQNIRLDSARATDILTDFLTEVKLGKESSVKSY